MNKLLYAVTAIALFFVYACGTARKVSEDSFYNRRNELGVKSKDGWFSSLHVSFGPYSTGEKEKGVNNHIIGFKTQRSPFHFSLSDNHDNTTSIQAVYTNRKDLKDNDLISPLNTKNAEVFYAWVGGGSVNALKNWELMVLNPTYEGLKHNDQVGVFRSVDEVITVHANDRFGNVNSYQNICYEFRLRGLPVAAVRVNGDNKVWIDKQLDEETKFALAGAIASFLMR